MDLEVRLATLERQQALLQARHDIWQTITRYARGIDEQRDEELAAIFTDDVVLTSPGRSAPWWGKPWHSKHFRTIAGPFSTRGSLSPIISFPSTTMAQLPVTPIGFWCSHGRSNRTVAGAATSGSFVVKMAGGRSAACSLLWSA